MANRAGLTFLLLVSCIACLAMVARAVGPNRATGLNQAAGGPQSIVQHDVNQNDATQNETTPVRPQG